MTIDEEYVLIRGYAGVPWSNFHDKPSAAFKAQLPLSAGYVPGVPRLGIPPLLESDASLGVANGGNMRRGDTATALPSSLLTTATFNPALAYDSGVMLGTETRAKGFNVILAGGINLAREPRGGRTFEYAGEDPWLAGVMVGESIRGIQSQGVLSTAKHFAFNDQETARTVMSVSIADSDARESDLLAFQLAIERGNPGSIMCSYNRIHNIYGCENPQLLNQVLKGDWGYKGFVMSDWGGVHSTVQAANSGLDQESCNGCDPVDFFGVRLRQAVAARQVPEARIHDMAHRILRSMFATGLFDKPIAKSPINAEAGIAVARRTAEEGIVLLKNDKALLPLDPAKRQKIALIGGWADLGVPSGGGSSQVHGIGHHQGLIVKTGGGTKEVRGEVWNLPKFDVVLHAPAPLDEIRKAAPKARLSYTPSSDIAAAVAAAKRADVAIVFVHQHMQEGWDVLDLNLPGHQNELIAAVAAANPKTIVILETGGPVAMPWVDTVPGILEAWYSGNGGAAAIAGILFGKVNPSGHLPVTFPITDSQLPHPIITGLRPDGVIVPTKGTPTAYDVIYQEGSRIGYRWFEDQRIQPLFPFGHGLSYTTFAYENLKVTGGNTIRAELDVKNTGSRPGKAAAQVYVKPPFGPSRLVGFAKVDLAPGESKHVVLTADPRLIAMFDSDANLWRIAEGDYVVRAGGSALDKAASATAHINAGTAKP